MVRGNETILYKISEAANILGVKPGVLRTWDERGLIKTIRTPGGTRLFDISSLTPDKQVNRTEKRIILYSRVSSAK